MPTLDYFKEHNMYLDAYKSDAETIIEEIAVCYEDNDQIKNLTNYDKDFLKRESDALALELKMQDSKEYNFTLIDNGYYENNNYKYIYLHYTNDEVYVYFYQTVVNGKTYLIMKNSITPISESLIKDFRENIIDKVKFNQDNSLIEEEKKEEPQIKKFIINNLRPIIYFACLIIFSLVVKFIAYKKEKKEFKSKNKDNEFW